MDNENNPQQRRASLRGKGREILLGQQNEQAASPSEEQQPSGSALRPSGRDPVDPSSLALSPEETGALLDFSPDAPAFDETLPLPGRAAGEAIPQPERKAPPRVEAPAELEEFEFPEDDETYLNWVSAHEPLGFEPDEDDLAFPDMPEPAVMPETMVMPDMPEEIDIPLEAPDEEAPSRSLPRTVASGDALPLGERSPDATATFSEGPYTPHRALDSLTPAQPEVWDEHEGGFTAADAAEAEAEEPQTPVIPDPFIPSPERRAATELFPATNEPNQDLLNMLVDDQRIRRLADQIEALQEDLATNFPLEREMVDTYQRELLQANGMLLESRENYDDARAIVYRVRADVNRQRQVRADIGRYRPMLLNYYIGWGIALGVLFLLKALFTGVTDAVGIETASAMYYPMLLGVAGALVSGLLTLERHTTRLRDFDPIHISWYLFNPLLGGVMGLLMFLLASIANEDLLREAASDAEHAITYLLCVVAGMNQNNVLRRLNDLLERFGRGVDNGQSEA